MPLNTSDVVPDDAVIADNPPLIGFTLDTAYTDVSKLSCFASGIGKVELTHLENNRVEIRLPSALSDRHTRINCTMPDDVVTPGEPRRWRWFGMLLILPDAADDDENTIDNGNAADTSENPESQ